MVAIQVIFFDVEKLVIVHIRVFLSFSFFILRFQILIDMFLLMFFAGVPFS